MRDSGRDEARSTGSQKRSNGTGNGGRNNGWWITLAIVCLALVSAPLAAQDRPSDALDALRRRLRAERPGAEQRRRAARRQQPCGAFQQRVPVGFPAGEHRADQPVGHGAAAVAGLGIHLSTSTPHRHLRPIDAELRADPGRPRRDHRPRPHRLRQQPPVLLLRSAGRRERSPAFPASSATTTSRPAAAAPTSSPRATRSRRRSPSSPAP